MKSYILIISFILLSQQTSSKLIYNLVQICPSYEMFKNRYEKLQEIKRSKKFNKNSMGFSVETFLQASANLQFYTNFVKKITENPQMIGFGSFGAIYSMRNLFKDQGFKDTKMAVKLLKMQTDITQEKVKKEQETAHREISIMNKLNRKPGGKFYFPTIMGCAWLTQVLTPYIHDIPEHQRNSNNALKMLTMNFESREFLAIKMQQLDLSYKTFLNNSFGPGKEGLPFVDRIKIAHHLFEGLARINEEYLHCDIKPDNLMIKIYKSLKHKKNLPLIHTENNEFITIKYIDFGMVVSKKEKCWGGTYGFVPPENFMKLKPYDKTDLYSLGVLLFDTEILAINKLSKLRDIVEAFNLLVAKKSKKMLKRDQNKMMKFELFKKVVGKFATNGLSSVLLAEFDQIDNNHLSNTKYQSISALFKLKSASFPGIFDHTPEYCWFVFSVALKLYMLDEVEFEKLYSEHLGFLKAAQYNLGKGKLSSINDGSDISFDLKGAVSTATKLRKFDTNLMDKTQKNISNGTQAIYHNELKPNKNFKSLFLEKFIKIEKRKLDIRRVYLSLVLDMVQYLPMMRGDTSSSISKTNTLKNNYYKILSKNDNANINYLGVMNDNSSQYVFNNLKKTLFADVNPELPDDEISSFSVDNIMGEHQFLTKSKTVYLKI